MGQHFHILIADDSPDDVAFMKSSMKKAAFEPVLETVSSGLDLLNFLRKKPPYKEAFTPQLVILDLQIQGMSGLEILEIINHDDNLNNLPILILTDYKNDDVIKNVNDFGVHSILEKHLFLESCASIMENYQTSFGKRETKPS